MPTYDYLCEKCGEYEVSQRITEPALTACPRCGGSTKRLLSPTSFVLKGSGWYKTDYATGSSLKGGGVKSEKKNEPSSEKKESSGKTEPKPGSSSTGETSS
jgi:putative FmdB family regulatory protein